MERRKYLPNLCYLELSVSEMDEKDLKILHLTLWSRATITVHPTDGCFQKLRTLVLGASARFVHNEDFSVSFTFTIWKRRDTQVFGSKTRDACITALPTIMPDLEVLLFEIYVRDIILNNGSCDNLGSTSLRF